MQEVTGQVSLPTGSPTWYSLVTHVGLALPLQIQDPLV